MCVYVCVRGGTVKFAQDSFLITKCLKLHVILFNLFSLCFQCKAKTKTNPKESHSSITVNEYREMQGGIEKSIMHLLAMLFHYLVINVQNQYHN